MGKIMLNGKQYGVGGIERAEGISYDNTQSGMSATNVQGALDEVKSGLTNKSDKIYRLMKTYTNVVIPASGYVVIQALTNLPTPYNGYYILGMFISGGNYSYSKALNIIRESNGNNIDLVGEPQTVTSITIAYILCENAQSVTL